MMKSENTLRNENTTRGDGAGLDGTSSHEIPKFDLAEQIMVEQRKVASIKRKAPSRSSNYSKAAKPVEQSRRSDAAPTVQPQISSRTDNEKAPETQYAAPSTAGAEQIIAEIVARDIRRFRAGSIPF